MGRRLLAAAEETLRAQGIRVIAALIESDNDPSIRLFAEAGYRVHRGVLYLSRRDSDDA